MTFDEALVELRELYAAGVEDYQVGRGTQVQSVRWARETPPAYRLGVLHAAWGLAA